MFFIRGTKQPKTSKNIRHSVLASLLLLHENTTRAASSPWRAPVQSCRLCLLRVHKLSSPFKKEDNRRSSPLHTILIVSPMLFANGNHAATAFSPALTNTVNAAYKRDPIPAKLNLAMGVYRTEDGQPLVLNVVKWAEKLILNDLCSSKEYLPITGMDEFNTLSAKLLFGVDSAAIRENRVTTVQCVSGSGSLRVGAEFLAMHCPQSRPVCLSQPTYENHPFFLSAVGIPIETYRYYDPATHGLNFQGLLEDLDSAPAGAVVMLHACAHNPTGVDPTVNKMQWEKMRQLIRSKRLLPFFDCAYQGFASGNQDVDAKPVRMFVHDGGECVVAQSFSKNMGMYGERVGALSIVCKTADIASRVESQIKLVIRPMYWNPPIHGALVVATVLKHRELYDEWTVELRSMADRVIRVRQQLYDALSSRGTPGNWTYILKQIGMFAYTSLTPQQVSFMTKEYHIYLSPDGTINIAGLGPNTVPYLADAIHAAVTRY
ncbi:hypothetical protein Droror1_Dr00020172 [Drosera rotundifolia]